MIGVLLPFVLVLVDRLVLCDRRMKGFEVDTLRGAPAMRDTPDAAVRPAELG